MVSLITSMFKIINNILPTNERMHICKVKDNNKCDLCSRVDDQGHLFLCKNNPLEKLTSSIIEVIRETMPYITFERIIQFDMNHDKEKIFSIGLLMTTTLDYYYKQKRMNRTQNVENLLTEIEVAYNIHNTQDNNPMDNTIIEKVIKATKQKNYK